MTLTFPIPVTRLREALPHRPPMVWLDEVLEATPTAGKARVHVDVNAAYGDGRGVRPSAALEWMAQAYGYVQAAHALMSGTTALAPKRAFLASVTSLRIERALADARGDLTITVDGFRPFGPLVLFHGVIHDAEGHVLAEGRLKIFAEP